MERLEKITENILAACIIIILIFSVAVSGMEADSANVTETENGASMGENLAFSASGGLYERPFTLTLSTNISGGIIRYTLDGSEPISESPAYSEGIEIEDRTGYGNLLSAIVTGISGGPGGGMGRPRGDNGGVPSEPQGAPGGDFQSGLQNDEPPQRGERPSRNDGITPLDMSVEGFVPPDGSFQLDDDAGRPGESAARGFPGGMNGEVSEPEENVFKGTVIKAAVFSEVGEMLTGVSTHSYFVSEDIFTRYGDLPVVSIATDADYFFDDETGIYINYNQSGTDWERPVHFEMFEAEGNQVISQSMGVRISGGTTRLLAQKTLRFYAKKEYDEENKTIEYEMFGGLTKSNSEDILTSFKRILLRSSGNDNSGALFRDALMQSLVSDLNVDTQAYRPCIAFLNGEFWGIYNICERYDDHYFASHYDIDAVDVAVLEISNDSRTAEISEGDESDLAFYNEMLSFFNNNSMTDESSYMKAQEYLDIDNFIDYYIANIYSGNTDWPANNNVFWRYKTENGGYDSSAVWYKDGRFRWVLKDMDFGFGLMTNQTNDTLAHALNENSAAGGGQNRGGGMGFTSDESTLMFRKLIENDDFKAKFINRFCDVMNTNYDADTVIAAISGMKAEIEPAISEQSNRYSSSVSSTASWEASIEKMVEFAKERAGNMRGLLQNRFSLSEVITVTLNTEGSGYIRINDTDINVGTKGVTIPSSWSGSYFAETEQTFTAIALDGHEFLKFVVMDNASGNVSEYTDDVISVTLGEKGTDIKAVFK